MSCKLCLNKREVFARAMCFVCQINMYFKVQIPLVSQELSNTPGGILFKRDNKIKLALMQPSPSDD